MEISRTYRYLVRELNIPVEPPDPTSYIPKFISDLDLHPDVEVTARKLIANAKEKGIHSGKNPVGLAAAAIYAALALLKSY